MEGNVGFEDDYPLEAQDQAWKGRRVPENNLQPGDRVTAIRPIGRDVRAGATGTIVASSDAFDGDTNRFRRYEVHFDGTSQGEAPDCFGGLDFIKCAPGSD